jgi:tellurite resistance protein
VTDRDAFAERGRSLEEEYFHRKEREVIDKMRVRAAADEQRRRLGEKAGVADEEVLNDLQALGYTPETVMMLYLVPVIQTAWAEGGISPRERDLIVKAARSRGITEGTPCDQQLNMWLSTRPSEEMFEKSLRAIRTLLQAQPENVREDSEKNLLSLATAIASASGGIVGFRAVSPEEQQILKHISDELKNSGKA